MLTLNKSLKAWNTSAFNHILIAEIVALGHQSLPLQQALSQSSYVADSNINVTILNSSDDKNYISAKTGIFFFGIIAGSCCSDDPTPVDEIQEYCELEFKIDKNSAETTVTLLSDG